MRQLFALIAALLLGSPAYAQRIVVEGSACRALVAHVPAADTAYQPGIDARGRAVAPADLAGSVPVLAPSFTFDLRVDLAPHLPRSSPLFQPQLDVGRVTVTPEGVVTFNGQPLASPERAALSALCQRTPR